MSTSPRALIIGAGIGGLALGIRLRALGLPTTILEKHREPGGRAGVLRESGFTWDMGPTVITVPGFLDALFALGDAPDPLGGADFPPVPATLAGAGTRPASTTRYVDLRPVVPFYRIFFDDGSFFDFDGDPEGIRAQVRKLAPQDLEGYARFERDARAIFERGFLKLGFTYFGTPLDLARVVPDLLRLDAVRGLFRFTRKYFSSDKLRRVFSFEPLLIGGNPLTVPALYAMIHFVERSWGAHYAIGGTGALVRALARKFKDLGGELRLNSEVVAVNTAPARPGKPRVSGVTLASGEHLDASVVASNGDYARLYLDLVARRDRRINADWRIKSMRQSMSAFVCYFGFRAEGLALNLRHHNILLGERYEALLRDLFDRKVLPDDASHYVYLPTINDPSLAPPGHHAGYTLIPVPNNASGIDWATAGPALADRALHELEARGYLPELGARLVARRFITPDHFARGLNSHLGNAFGPEPVLTQTALLRPHNRSEDVRGLYLVGAGTQPGAGMPAVMMSAQITARLIAEDLHL